MHRFHAILPPTRVMMKCLWYCGIEMTRRHLSTQRMRARRHCGRRIIRPSTGWHIVLSSKSRQVLLCCNCRRFKRAMTDSTGAEWTSRRSVHGTIKCISRLFVSSRGTAPTAFSLFELLAPPSDPLYLEALAFSPILCY